MDLATPPFGKLTPFHVYAVLSRSRGKDDTRLLRDFEGALFSTHPTEDLHAEDGRLRRLEDRTEHRRTDEFEGW